MRKQELSFFTIGALCTLLVWFMVDNMKSSAERFIRAKYEGVEGRSSRIIIGWDPSLRSEVVSFSLPEHTNEKEARHAAEEGKFDEVIFLGCRDFNEFLRRRDAIWEIIDPVYKDGKRFMKLSK